MIPCQRSAGLKYPQVAKERRGGKRREGAAVGPRQLSNAENFLLIADPYAASGCRFFCLLCFSWTNNSTAVTNHYCDTCRTHHDALRPTLFNSRNTTNQAVNRQ